MDRLLIEYRDYGVAVQRAILRILAQYLPKEFQEVPFLSDPFWRKEADWILGDAPPIPPSFQKEKAVGIAFFNAVFFSGDRLVHGLRHSWEERALLKEWHAKVVLGGINSEIKLAREAYEARNDEDVWRHLTYASVFSEKRMLDPILYWLSQIGSRPTFKGKHE